MIQKVSNTSFKGIYPLKSMEGIDLNNYNKLLPVINMDEAFPHNDIFLGRTPKNNLLIEVREKDNLKEILCEEAINSSELSTQDFCNLAVALQKLKLAYLENHPEKSYTTSTKETLDRLSMFDIAKSVYNAVETYNQKYHNKPN